VPHLRAPTWMSRTAMVLVLVGLAAARASAADSSPPPSTVEIRPLPSYDLPSDESYSSSALHREGLAGRVLVAFHINSGGRARDLRVMSSDSSALEMPALAAIKDARFDVPADWEASGATAQEYLITVGFQQVRHGQRCRFDPLPPSKEVLGICTARTVSDFGRRR
jgi:TonB family protein